jgi:O-antigen/teichoic acid export membrane protein
VNHSRLKGLLGGGENRVLLKNILFKGGAEGISRLLKLAVWILPARLLGAEPYASFAFAYGFALFFGGSSDFGIAQLTCRSIAERVQDTAKAMKTAVLLKSALLAIHVPLIGVVAWAVSGNELELRLIWILSVSSVASSVLDLQCNVMRGHQRLDLEAAASVVGSVLLLAGAVVPLSLGGGPLALAVGVAAASVAALIPATMLAAKVGAFRAWKAARVDWAGLVEALKALGALGPLTLIWLGLFNLETLVLKHFSDPLEIGYYSVATKLTGGLVPVSAIVMAAVFPAFVSRKDVGARRRLAAQVLAGLTLIGVVLASILALGAQGIVRVVFGGAVGEASSCLRLLCWILPLCFPALAMSQLLVGLRRSQITLGWAVLSVLGTGAGCCLLAPRFGASGVAMAKLADAALSVVFFGAFLASALRRSSSPAPRAVAE